MKRLLLVAIAALSLLPAVALALPRSMPDPQATELRGGSVTPRSFEFSSLPRVSSVPYVGPVSDGHPEGVWEQADEELERLKEHPEAPDLQSLGAHLTLDTTPAGGGGFSPFAPTLGAGFEGITQGPYIPSEPACAAGPLNVFSTGNIDVTVADKDGSNRVETNGAAFFGVGAGESAISDAQCYFDAVHGRFVAVAFTTGTSPSNYSNFYVVISKTGDARGAWWQYKFDMTKDGANATNNWSDYESLGITEDKLVLTGQQFTFTTNSYQYPKIRVIDRAALFSGSAASYVDFVNFSAPVGGDGNDVFVTKCARDLTPADSTAHLLCVRVNGGTNVTYREVTGPPSSPSLSAGLRVTVSAYSAPPNAVQKGTTTLVPTNDCRPGDFVVRNGVLVIAWHFGATISSTTVSAVRLLRLRTSDLAVLTDETFGAASTFYFYPCATVDSAGTVYLGFGRSSSTEFPSAYVSARRPSDASIEPSTLTKAGLTSTSQTRWGDFTGIDNDASLSGPSGTSAWYSGQWTKGTNTFGTWINKLSFTYGQIGGSIADDCDGNAATTSDRLPRANVTVSLVQGAATVATTTTDTAGAYNFGYLEAGTYDVVVTPPPSGSAVDAVAGTGGTSQVRVSASDVQVAVTTTQASTGNQFVVTSLHPLPFAGGIAPNAKAVGAPGFTLTVNGSGFTTCSSVRVDGADRPTTYVNPGQLTAAIPAGDLVAAGARAITVFTTSPGGGTSGPQYLTVSGSPDTQAPVVSVTSPAGGESWAVGSTHNITWTATDNVVVATVDLALSTDGGATFPTAIVTGITNSGSFAWTLPLTLSSTARVRVTAHDGVGNAGADSSHANFTLAGWTVAASAGANGAIAPTGALVVPDGAAPAFTITPATGYHVLDVLVNGGSVGAVTSFTFPPVHANQSIAASFAVNTYTLTVGVSGGGSVAKSPDQPTYDHGTLVTLTATPTAGYTFAGWTGDSAASANPITILMRSNRSFTANFGLHTYVWNQTVSANWATPTNWSPTRTTPATDDVLIFNGGGSPIVANVPTQTIGQLIVANNTNVSLTAGVSGTLTIAGNTGTDLDVPAGSTLSLNGTSALTVALATGTTGSVAGTVAVTVASHKLVAKDAGSLVFKSGSLLTLGTGFGTNIFGTGTGTSGLNSVVFQAGSLLAQASGLNPFGAAAPSAVVVFQPGSRYRIDGNVPPAMGGRTYGDLEYNYLNTISVNDAAAWSVDSLIVTLGTLNLNTTGGGTLRGDIRVRPSAGLGFAPALGTPTVSFAGAAAQRIAIFGTFTNASNAGFALNNAAGVTLATNWTLAGPLAFTSGRVTTGANTLAISATGGVSGAAQGTGWVAGNLRRTFASGSSSLTLDVGDGATYAPVTLAVNGAGSAFDLVTSTSAGDHASLATSDLDPAKSVNRTWTLGAVGTPSFTSADATFNFAAADVDAGANPANFLVRRYSGGWTAPTLGARTATSTQATGLTAFGDFAVAEPFTWTITASAGAHGAIVPSGAVSVAPGAGQAFTITPDSGYNVADVLVDGGSVGPVTGYTFNTVGANHTIAASFASAAAADTIPPSVTVTAPNGGESLTEGAVAPITWTATDNVAVTAVDVLLSRSGSAGVFDTLAAGIANSGSHPWTVTSPGSTDAWLRVIAHDAAGNTASDLSDAAFTIVATTGVDDGPVTTFALGPVVPNPTHGGGRTSFALPRAAHVHLSLLDVQGREVLVLADGEFGAGRHSASFGGRAPIGAGLYFVRMRVENGPTFTRRLAVAR